MKARAAATPVALLVLAGGAVAYAYLDRAAVSDADRAARRRDVFPSLRVDEVSRVELVHGAETVVLERAAGAQPAASGAWRMTSPRDETADPAAIDALLRELDMAMRVRDVGGGGTFGLDAPRARARVRVGALEYRFSLGDDAPLPEGAAYLRVEGEGTFVVDRALKVQLLRGADAYRERTIVPLAAGDIARVEVTAPGGRGFALERHGATFRIGGAGLRASRSGVERVLSALLDARAETFADGRLDERSSGDVVVRVVPVDPGRAPVELRLGAACGGPTPGTLVVRTSPPRTAACTSVGLAEVLAVSPESLEDRSPLFARADEIEQVRLEAADGGAVRVEVARKGSGWHERAPDDRDLDADESESANVLALALAGAQSEDRPRPAGGRAFAARARATVVRTGGATSEVVEVGAPGRDGYADARRLDDGALLRLTRAAARRFAPHPVALRPRLVWRAPFDPGEAVAVEENCSPVRERVELGSGAWVMRSPPGFDPDASAVADVTAAVARAKADAWVAEKDDGEFGFGGPGSCRVTLGLAAVQAGGPPRAASIEFGAEGEAGVYARALDDPAVFVAPRSLRDLVSRPAVDRSRLRLDPGLLGSVVLSRGGARVVLVNAGAAGWRRAREAASDDAGADERARLESAIAGMQALMAVHTGAAQAAEGMDAPTLDVLARPRADAAAASRGERRITIGAPATVDAQDVYFARVSGVDATFAVPRRAVGALLDVF